MSQIQTGRQDNHLQVLISIFHANQQVQIFACVNDGVTPSQSSGIQKISASERPGEQYVIFFVSLFLQVKLNYYSFVQNLFFLKYSPA